MAEVIGRCATCRHAEPAPQRVGRRSSLLCKAIKEEHATSECSALAALGVTDNDAADLFVSPDFGCVMYDAVALADLSAANRPSEEDDR